MWTRPSRPRIEFDEGGEIDQPGDLAGDDHAGGEAVAHDRPRVGAEAQLEAERHAPLGGIDRQDRESDGVADFHDSTDLGKALPTDFAGREQALDAGVQLTTRTPSNSLDLGDAGGDLRADGVARPQCRLPGVGHRLLETPELILPVSLSNLMIFTSTRSPTLTNSLGLAPRR